jgi:hypothetical protein
MENKRLELKLPAPVVAPLLEFLLPLARETGDAALAFEPNLEAIEDDFRNDWRADIAGQSQDDQTRFAAIFDTEEFRKNGVAEFGPEDCEPLLRASSALRLKLRSRKLGALADSALETGEIDYARLNKDERTAITSYMLLASLQEIVIRHLDPDSAE